MTADDPITRLNAALEGRYRIERQLGEGGMATVYLARDLKHNRNVALKVLKPELAAVVGADRFLAEIETTANLQHPHILPLFDSGEADSFLFYVMPYVEGESLRQRLDREHQLPVDEAVAIARNVAEALDYAHRRGVIHRDIKPANILLQDGKPVVSDFGIALALGAAGAGRLTETGLSLGTPHYMSPEQATGDLHVGAPTDIYALGCVLYEMLVGEPPYTGSTPQAVLGKIVTGEADPVTRHRRSVPPNVDAAIRKALEKVPSDRFGSAGELARALGDAGFRHGQVDLAPTAPMYGRLKTLAISACSLAAVTAGLAVWSLTRSTPEPARRVASFESFFRPDQAPQNFSVTAFTMSPDGSMIVYWGPSESVPGGWQLWVRRWDNLSAVPLPNTEFGWNPSISNDGRSVAFGNGEVVSVASFDGGPVRTLAEGDYPRWGPEDEYIYFRVEAGRESRRVRAAGGEPERVTQVGEGEVSHFINDILPGGEQALVRVALDGSLSEVRLLTIATGEMKPLFAGTWPTYVEPGYILFLTQVNGPGPLMAAPFDLRRGEVTGPAQMILENVWYYSISESGDLVYTSSGGTGNLTELVWVNRNGQVTPVDPGWRFENPTGFFYGWRLSPAEDQIAYAASAGGRFQIWVKDLPAGLGRQLTFDETQHYLPWWTPDGTQVTYLQGESVHRQVWTLNVDGTGQPAQLMDGAPSIGQGVWSQDGTWLVLRTFSNGGPGPRDIVAFRPSVDTEVVPILTSPDYGEELPALSPDGRWLAYTSERTNPYGEVFVSPFPNVEDGRWPISQGGGFAPVWGHSGRELFFVSAENKMVAASVDAGATFRLTALDTLFAIPSDFRVQFFANFFDVTRDDQRFLMGRAYGGDADDEGDSRYVLVQNFVEVLKGMVPTN